MKGNDLILIGGLAIGGYLLYKMLSGRQETGNDGSYSIGWIPGDTTPTTPMNADTNTPTYTPVYTPTAGQEPMVTVTPTTGDITVTPIQTPIQRPLIQYSQQVAAGERIITIPAPIGVTAVTLTQPRQQSWTGATYGQAGQPSVSFLANTLTAATQKTAPTTTRIAAAAVAAAAPPRVVAKIKAGRWY